MRSASSRVLAWGYVIAWMSVIYYFSDQPDLHSALPSSWDSVLRKIAHVAEYFVLSFLLFRALVLIPVARRTALLGALVMTLAYALSDEWHQHFVAGRQGSLRDVLVDSLGYVVFWFLQRSRNV